MRTLIILYLLSAVILSGCMPRGESKTLDQVLETARQRYHANSLDSLSQDAKTSLESLAARLQEMEDAGGWEEFGEYSRQALDLMPVLESKAGMTAQAAFDEVENQYRELSARNGEFNRASIKLLLARTYNLLASELESTRFNR